MKTTTHSCCFLVLVTSCLCAMTGCGGKPAAAWVSPAFDLAPGVVGPSRTIGYDTNGDGRVDYLQACDDRGVKTRFLFDTDHDGTFDVETAAADVASGSDDARYLFVLLDGVSYSLLADMWKEGHFRLFPEPSQVIPGFPTVTDTIYADFFSTPRPFGYEAAFYDLEANKVAGGEWAYLFDLNEPVWPEHLLYRQAMWLDGVAYVYPVELAGRELNKGVEAAMRWLDQSDSHLAAVYSVSTDTLGHIKGRQAVREYLLKVDVAIEKLFFLSQGKLRILCTADHGMNEAPMTPVHVDKKLRDAGFRIVDSLKEDRDVALPRLGLVSAVALYTRSPAAVAEAAVAVEGIEIAVYRDGNSFGALSAGGGRARIDVAADGRLRYAILDGDPLGLQPAIERMKTAGTVDAGGWAAEADWFQATWDHVYPDPLRRIVRAFRDDVRNPADVILSLGEEYYYGDLDFDMFTTLVGTHGSLRQSATTTFALSNFAPLPGYLSAADLRARLEAHLGVETLLPPDRRK